MFTIKLDNRNMQKKLGGLAKGVKDFKTPLSSAGDELLTRYSNRVFENQKPDDGPVWKPLALSTIYARNRRIGYYRNSPVRTDKILIWTGRLQKGFRKIVSSRKLIIENTVEYFKYHQRSQRKMLFINDSVKGLVARHIIKHLRKSMR